MDLTSLTLPHGLVREPRRQLRRHTVKRYRLATVFAGFAALGLIPGIALAASNATASSQPTVQAVPVVQAVPSSCPDLVPIRQAADHWISGHKSPADSTWFNSLFIKGDVEAFKMTGDAKYWNYATAWGNHNKWLLPKKAPNYDGPEASQEYLDIWELDPAH